MSKIDLQNLVDDKYKPEQSIILRYHKSGLSGLTESDHLPVSQKEGARIFHLLDYKKVPIFILDETTLMTTNTFEALVAEITLAHCKKFGYKKIVFSSGGNLGVALSNYASKAGIESYSFNPLNNMSLLDEKIFKNNGAHLIAVKDTQKTRKMMLEFKKRMERSLNYDPLVPQSKWRFEALGYRGFFIAEFMIKNRINFEAISQTLSAGFGPLGTYEILGNLFKNKNITRLPKFLGIQQEANCYFFQKWSRKKIHSDSPLIVPTLFDKNPDKTFGTYNLIKNLLKNTKGCILTISQGEFDNYISKDILKALSRNGIQHVIHDKKIIFRSGLMALSGLLKAIDNHFIENGPVLVCMTDGVREYTKPAQPEFVISEESDLKNIQI